MTGKADRNVCSSQGDKAKEVTSPKNSMQGGARYVQIHFPRIEDFVEGGQTNVQFHPEGGEVNRL